MDNRMQSECETCVLVIDVEGRLCDVSAGIRLFEYSFEEALGMPFELLVHPDDRTAANAVLFAHKSGVMAEAELRFCSKSGAIHVVDMWGHQLQQGDNAAGVAVVRHTSARRQLRNQRMEWVGHVAGGIAHDFLNQIAVVANYVSVIQAALGKNSGLDEDLKEMAKATSRAASLVRRLLTFSRGQTSRSPSIDVNHVVDDMGSMFHWVLGSNVEFVASLDPELDSVYIERCQFEQVLMNLITNARDAMPDGGTVSVVTSRPTLAPQQRAALGLLREGSYALLSVSDDGVGMEASVCARIFEPFFTTKEERLGFGLGLATVSRIVSQNGGAIAVQSEPNKGTTFSIFLPCFAIDDASDELQNGQRDSFSRPIAIDCNAEVYDRAGVFP